MLLYGSSNLPAASEDRAEIIAKLMNLMSLIEVLQEDEFRKKRTREAYLSIINKTNDELEFNRSLS
jgi:hypothetical protein